MAAVLLTLLATSLAGQATLRLAQQTRFTKVPGGAALGTLQVGAEVTPGRTSGAATEIALEGWFPSASLGPMKRDGFDVAVSKRPSELLRQAPDGPATAKVSPGVGFIKVETRGTWTRVKRTAWVDRKALQAVSTPVVQQVTGPDQAEVTQKSALAIVPGGATVGSIDSGAGARVLAHSGGWSRIQVEAWVPDSALRPTDRSVLVGLSQAEVRANPAKYVGQVVEWRVQFVAIQKSDELRPEIPEGLNYLLTRGPLPEPGFVYIIIPSSAVAQFQAVPALRELTIRGTIRSATTKYLPTPVLELVEVVAGLGK
ncbi:MAG: hypothetical protein ABI742_00035 [Gemmatimonadota bacterium]